MDSLHLDSADIPQIAALWLRNNYAPAIPRTQLIDHIRWKYDSRRAVIYSQREEGRIFATTGYLKGSFCAGNSVLAIGWGMDSLIDEPLRDGRVFAFMRVLRSTMRSCEHEILVAFANRNVHDTYLRIGFRPWNGFFFYQVKLQTAAELPVPPDRGFDLLWKDELDVAGVEALFGRTQGFYQGISPRDQEYLGWRFARCPFRRHVFLHVYRRGLLVGYCAVRFVLQPESRTAYIVDLLDSPDDESVLKAMLPELLARCRKLGIALIQTVLTNGRISQLMLHYGFIRQQQETVLVWLKSDRARRFFEQDSSGMHLTMSDGDYDME